MTVAAPEDAWRRRTLTLAGWYNLLWGAAVVLAPGLAFQMFDMEPPRYPGIWQCVGMIVGVYGIGYLVAARDSRRHWPIVLVGFFGKVFGPIGFVVAATQGELPWSFGAVIVFNDLVWLLPFALLLWDAARAATAPPATDDLGSLESELERALDQHGVSLLHRSRAEPTLVVLLRHSGCTFCREALADLQRQRELIARHARLAIVHMSSDADAERTFAAYGLDDVPRISDPQQRLYRALDIGRGTFAQLFGPKVWLRGAQAFLAGHGIGALDGDGFQMPGAVVLRGGRVVARHEHASAADRPRYHALACPAGVTPAGGGGDTDRSANRGAPA